MEMLRTTSLMTSLLAVVSRHRRSRRIDLGHNGRRFLTRFCSTGGDQALHAHTRGSNPGG